MSDAEQPFTFRATSRPVLRCRSVMWDYSNVGRLGPRLVSYAASYGIFGLPKHCKGTHFGGAKDGVGGWLGLCAAESLSMCCRVYCVVGVDASPTVTENTQR